MQGSMSAPAQNEFDQVMQTNVLAAMRLLPILAPIVASTHGRLAVISSVMGSIAERTQNGMSLYRASKAALNSVLRDIALEPAAKGAICVAMHPGWVRTEMGGPNADISVDVSVAGIRQTLSKLTPEDNSSFYGYDGNKINW
jgi:NAD(P)-dependent dehydrogenase (short-subunit alcohol dehydrogenase family)